jgi:hypothetical protein
MLVYKTDVLFVGISQLDHLKRLPYTQLYADIHSCVIVQLGPVRFPHHSLPCDNETEDKNGVCYWRNVSDVRIKLN